MNADKKEEEVLSENLNLVIFIFLLSEIEVFWLEIVMKKNQ